MILPEVTTLAEARVAIRDLAEEVEKLSNELAWFRRQLFGSKTEHYIPRDDTPSLFPEEMSPESPKEVPTATVAEHERKVRQPNALSEIPADLPREERVIDVPEEKRQGMILIGYEESERIAYQTGLYVIHFKRATLSRKTFIPTYCWHYDPYGEHYILFLFVCDDCGRYDLGGLYPAIKRLWTSHSMFPVEQMDNIHITVNNSTDGMRHLDQRVLKLAELQFCNERIPHQRSYGASQMI